MHLLIMSAPTETLTNTTGVANSPATIRKWELIPLEMTSLSSASATRVMLQKMTLSIQALRPTILMMILSIAAVLAVSTLISMTTILSVQDGGDRIAMPHHGIIHGMTLGIAHIGIMAIMDGTTGIMAGGEDGIPIM